MIQFEAKVIADSAHAGARITTFQLCYPRFIHAELMTHRIFSRNASSSRAIPVAKMIEQVRHQPAEPCHWGLNQPGMQARREVDEGTMVLARHAWLNAAQAAADFAGQLAALGIHKQVANRVLEPYQFMHTVLTGTDFSNFFELRDHEDADPNMEALAKAMRRALYESTPIERPRDRYSEKSWHLPYVTAEERQGLAVDVLVKCSVARCARVSYNTHDGKPPALSDDLLLYGRLVGSHPIHASPAEHQAYPTPAPFVRSNNFVGWRQYRETLSIGERSREAA